MGNFDVDLDFGQIYEEKIKNLFEGDGRIEVKTERDIWADTGNMAIEIRSRKGGDDKTSDIILAPISTLILLNKKF
jgi:hypothetical protein